MTNSNDQSPCMDFEYLSSSQESSHNDGHNLLFQTNEWGYIANNRRGELNSGYHDQDITFRCVKDEKSLLYLDPRYKDTQESSSGKVDISLDDV